MEYPGVTEKNFAPRRGIVIKLAALVDSIFAICCLAVAFYLTAIAGLCTESAYRRKTEQYWCEGRTLPRIGGECSPCGLIYLTLYGNNSLSQVALVWVGILYSVFLLLLPAFGATALMRYAFQNVTSKQLKWYTRRWTILFYVFVVHIIILFLIRVFNRQYEGWYLFLAVAAVRIAVYAVVGVQNHAGGSGTLAYNYNNYDHSQLRTNSPVETTL